MAYEIRYTDFANKGTIVVEDNTVNTETSLQIPGRFYKGYGQAIAEDLLHLLENFASPTAPEKPIEGQLWYDNSEGVDQLKIYDGTSWLSSSGLKKSDQEPAASISNSGDLWVDTDNQQLYLYTGSQWILVGPTFSDGLVTGATPVTLIGQDNAEYTVLQIDVKGTTVGIISDDEFFLKSTIPGFTTGIKKGFNLSSLNNEYQFVGTAEKAAAVEVTNDPTSGVATVSANNLLRGDAPSTTNYQLRVKNNNGITIGSSNELGLSVEGGAAILQHNTSGSNIDVRVKDGASLNTVIRIDSTSNVGINNLAPGEALDVIGNIQISPRADDATTGRLIVTSLQQSLDIDEGSIVTDGGVGIRKNLNVGQNAKIIGQLETGNIIPDQTSSRTIGTNGSRYDQVYANTYFGRLQGDVDGNVSGRAGNAERLTTSTNFAMTGDVSSPSFAFDGKSGESTKTFVTTIADTFIANKETLRQSLNSDEIIINKTQAFPGETQGTGLYKISKLNFLKSIPLTPIGSILPYGGQDEPDGWLFCDGREVLKSQFNELFAIIGYAFKDPINLTDGGLNLFALPDMRGRFPLGLDNMGEESRANRVTGDGAIEVGNNLGSESVIIDIINLPEHEHDLRGESGSQYYIIRDNTGIPLDDDAIQYDAPTGTLAGQAYPSSGGIKTTTDLGQPLDIMNPYLALNYIIYTGT